MANLASSVSSHEGMGRHDIDGSMNGTESVYMTQTQAIIVTSISLIIAILGILGNCLVFVAVALSRKLHTATNAFVINLAVADFLSSLVLPFQARGILSDSGWPLDMWVCKGVAILFLMCNGTSILTLTAIAINRYILITCSRRTYDRIYTRKSMVAMLVSMWVLSFIFFILQQLIPATGGFEYNNQFRTCLWDIDHENAMISQVTSALVLVICCSTILFCYVRIYLFVRRHVRDTEARLQMRGSRESLDIAEDPLQNSSRSSGPSRRQINITKNLATIVVVFFVCVLPYTMNLISLQYNIITVYLALLIILPNCTNPFIYAAKHPDFKMVFKSMICCRPSDIPLPSDLLKAISQNKNSTSS